MQQIALTPNGDTAVSVKRNHSIVLIDHNIEFVRGVCDHVVVLDIGHVIYAGDSDGVMRDEVVQRAYLGGGLLA